MSRSRVTLVLCVLVIGVLAVVVLRQLWPRSIILPQAVMYENSRAGVMSLFMIDMTSAQQVKVALTNMTIENRANVDDQLIDALRRTVSEALSLYYIESDSSVYRNWRVNAGATLRGTVGHSRTGWNLDDLSSWISASPGGHEFSLTAPLDAIELLYDDFRSIALRINRGANRAVRLANSPDGLHAVIGRVAGSSAPAFGLSGTLGPEAWYGGVGMSAMVWFENDIRLRGILERDGEVVVAEVGVFCEFADGTRRPIIFTLAWNPRRSLWQLEQVTMTNYPPGHIVWPWNL